MSGFRAHAWMILAGAIALALSTHAWAQADRPPTPEESSQKKGEYIPGEGFEVLTGQYGSLSISGYVLLRYLNQLPAMQSFTDHLGRERSIDTRHDIELHRMLVHFKGFLFSPKFTHQTSLWAVNSTTSVTGISALNYEFSKAFTLGGGIGAIPGTRSLNYEHPFFLGTDRQLADEFFRPSFSSGIWAEGEPISRFRYRTMLASALNMVNISAAQLTRDFALGLTLYLMPTTGEFGPRGGFGDFEMHDRVATRFGVSAVHSREDRFNQVNNPQPDNTSIRLSDSLLLFETGALAPGVTVRKTDYTTLAADASVKHQGFFGMAEFYFRKLSNFETDGPVPLNQIFDRGYMLNAAYMVVPQRFEVYGVHSFIFGQFNNSWELSGGLNYYPYRSRRLKLNVTAIYVNRSAYSSNFGYWTGGQTGPTIALSTDFSF